MEDRQSRPRRSGGHGSGGNRRRRVCRFCADATLKLDYKDAQSLRYFISERGKIVPRRISGTCAKHQRQVCQAVKRARNIALMPFTSPK
ncbi:MAG: 30S ribosomal protein S18 [Proteobacteria bacterium]|jgi:small subunit ribosomal protein S18|nr:30S ribosomal protein S18 [Pseudomonadota bacterium]NLN61990.1 30S ribosomal protein S18 [Myxococcales bacterium]